MHTWRLDRLGYGRDARVGLLAGAAGIVVVTIVIGLLQSLVPILSLGALYVFAVLPAAVLSGTAVSVVVAIVSMLAFNWFFLPPVHTFTLADPNNWFSLAVFLVIAVVVSELATRSRRRATESELLAEIATSLLERGPVAEELDQIAASMAQVLQVSGAWIELDTSSPARARGHVVPLVAGERPIGVVHLASRPRHAPSSGDRVIRGVASLVGVAVDRERLQREALEAEALRQSDALKTALLRTVSHDLRSPLMAIVTSASALQQPDLQLGAADRDDLLQTISIEAARLDRIVSNLLDLSRLQAGAAAPDLVIQALDDLVVQAIAELPDSARIHVTFDDTDATVRVDGRQVERILVNLLENALKYSPTDEAVRVSVTGTASEAIVRVIDHGPGFPPMDAERIFEPFQRGEGSGGKRGAGLGLAIARGFAQANGGRVWAESRSGQGATFVLALPAVAGVRAPA
jgi:two-component system, OmpR family, sensor histidine kinase KdpD